MEHLNVNKSFVSRIIARYRDTGSIASHLKSGTKKKKKKNKNGYNTRNYLKCEGQI